MCALHSTKPVSYTHLEAFAEKCGMHRTYISAIECFRRSISLENIQKIADALEIEPYQLLLENRENDQNE